MSFFKRNFNWRDSAAHLTLLAQFRQVGSAGPILNQPKWKQVLGEDQEKAIARFAKENLLKTPSLAEYLNSGLNAADLKVCLQKLGLKVSGRKSELIDRIAAANPSLDELIPDHTQFWMCTTEGVALAETFCANAWERESAAKTVSLEYLRAGRVQEAIEAVRRHCSIAVNYQGELVGWARDAGQVAAKVRDIREVRIPRLLADVDIGVLAAVREALCMAEIWGDSINGFIAFEYQTGHRLNAQAIGRMFTVAIWYHERVADTKRMDFKKVQILGVEDEQSCKECMAVANKKYRLGDLPEFPLANCSCAEGCRCEFIPAVD